MVDYGWGDLYKDLYNEVLDLADSGINMLLKPLNGYITKAAEEKGLILTEGQIEDLEKKLKEATRDYYEHQEEEGSYKADTSRSNPGGSAYWRRSAENAQAGRRYKEEASRLYNKVEDLSSKVDSARRDRDAATSSPTRTALKLYT